MRVDTVAESFLKYCVEIKYGQCHLHPHYVDEIFKRTTVMK